MANGVDFRRRGLIAAAAGGAGVLAVLLVQDILTALVSLAGSAPYVASGFAYLGTVFGGAWFDSLTTSIPLAVGVFLSFWQVAPIGAVLRLGHVVTRALLAVGIGSAAVLVVGVTTAAVTGFQLFADRGFAVVGDDGANVLTSVGYAVQTAAFTFVQGVPLVVLAAVLLWLWIRGRDREVPLEGILDL